MNPYDLRDERKWRLEFFMSRLDSTQRTLDWMQGGLEEAKRLGLPLDYGERERTAGSLAGNVVGQLVQRFGSMDFRALVDLAAELDVVEQQLAAWEKAMLEHPEEMTKLDAKYRKDYRERKKVIEDREAERRKRIAQQCAHGTCSRQGKLQPDGSYRCWQHVAKEAV